MFACLLNNSVQYLYNHAKLRMAPKVCVPADFGRHHIGAPSHGNLTFNLGEGVKIRANSIILSLNSPVIDKLTTNLHQTSLEADDFSREAVDCFVECTYTGEIEAVNLGNFRDVNKMSRVFQVSWLVAKCEEYFVSYLDKLDSESSYSDMLFVVEEAVYLMSAIKSRDFLDLVVTQMNKISVACRNDFVQNYISDLSKSSTVKIDACLYILQSDVHVMIEILISHIDNQGNRKIDENTRHVLKNIDLMTCGRDHPDILKKLFDLLENIQCEQKDFQLLLGITRQITIQWQQQIQGEFEDPRYRRHSKNAEKHPEKNTMYVYFFPISNDFMYGSNLSILLKNLASNEDVHNLYTYIDALWSSLFQGNDLGDQFKVISEIITLKEMRGWSMLNLEYVNRLFHDDDTTELLDPLKQCEKLVLKSSKLATAIICPYLSPEEFAKRFFLEDSTFTFSISDSMFANQEFVLKTTAMKDNNPDTFTIKYGFVDFDREQSERDLPKLNFAIEINQGTEECLFPLSWCGKPTCDVSKTYWNWGYLKFHDKEMSELEMMIESKDSNKGKLNYMFHYHRVSENCRMVAFLIL